MFGPIAVALFALASLLNALFDTPHEFESRPDMFEVCWFEDYSAAWIEVATPTGYVCDGTGLVLQYREFDNTAWTACMDSLTDSDDYATCDPIGDLSPRVYNVK